MKLLESYQPLTYRPPVRLLDFMREVGDAKLINLAAGVPAVSLLPVEELNQAYADAVASGGGSCYAYQRPEGDPGLREVLAERLQTRGVDLPNGKDEVLLTTGCTQALRIALELMVQPGDVVACESPCYYNLLEQIEALGAKALPVPVDLADGITPEALEPLLEQYQPKCLVVCSSLSNPSGIVAPEVNRPVLVELCRQHGVTIIEDDIYAELRDGGALPPLRSWDDGSQVLYVSSYCKSVAPGLRVGLFLPGPHFEAAAQQRCLEIMHGSTLAESILREFILDGGMEQQLQRLARTCRRRRRIVQSAVQKYFPAGTVCSDPQGGFLLWAVLPEALDLEKASQATLKRGVSFARGEVFLTGKPRTSCMRLNCARASEADLAKGIRVLGQVFRKIG
ncbi:MAG: PLP-dependent aminotransferase family protein [Gammaproteobacteria bacterium]|nr:PLP-dependent aminotransferase family protein [Gammaproteobacteria bacterium]